MARLFNRWFPCPCCMGRVPTGADTCPRCGHDRNSWKLIADVLALAGTRDLRYNQVKRKPTEGSTK